MLPAFKASFEVANYSPNVEYLNEGGLYSGIFRKAFLYDKLASDGSNNTFICFFLYKKTVNSLNNIKFIFQEGGDCNATCKKS